MCSIILHLTEGKLNNTFPLFTMETSRKSQYIRNHVCTETDCNNSTIYLSCTRYDLNEVGHILISSSTLKSNVNTSFSFNIYITKLKTHLPLHK